MNAASAVAQAKATSCTGSGAPSTKFTIGQQVQATAALNVRATASTNGTLVGTEASGTTGTVTGGPTNANGYNWWSISYANGISGWSVEDYLQAYTAQGGGGTAK